MFGSEVYDLWCTLSDFVSDVCKGRDESHGHAHMKNVAETSSTIACVEYSHHPSFQSIMEQTIIVAWLHDVPDHKYDEDGKLKQRVIEFLENEIKVPNAEYILDIIERISYSKEVRSSGNGNVLDWHEILGEEGVIVRNIVSDADKLEALGIIGLKRCIEYATHVHKKKTGKNITSETLVKNVVDHADEKLLRLKDEFIRTKAGKEMAESLHKEIEDRINIMREWIKEGIHEHIDIEILLGDNVE